MKFFKPELYDLGEDANLPWSSGWPEARERYLQYLETVPHQISSHTLEFEQLPFKEDGLLIRAAFTDSTAHLRLRCGAGDEYYDLDALYQGVVIGETDRQAIAEIAAGTFSSRRFGFDLARTEFEAVDGGLEHRYLFYSRQPDGFKEFAIRCDKFTWTRTPRRTRRFRKIEPK